MKCAGIDIAGIGLSAVALAIDGKPAVAEAWKPTDKRDSEAVMLYEFENWLNIWLWLNRPDIVVVEELAVFLNKNVIRSLARREGVALAVAKRRCSIVLNPGITKSRGIVFGNGRMSKDEAWEAAKKLWADFDFGHKTSGGTDKMDAMTHAIAGPTIAERR
jgi:Holliday junction resolvasome RuvABC endonuclease subunit